MAAALTVDSVMRRPLRNIVLLLAASVKEVKHAIPLVILDRFNTK